MKLRRLRRFSGSLSRRTLMISLAIWVTGILGGKDSLPSLIFCLVYDSVDP